LRLRWKIAWTDSLGGESAVERAWGAEDEKQRGFLFE